jgi:hypothetical protein
MTPSKDAAIQDDNNSRRNGFGVRNWKDVRQIQEQTGLGVYGKSKGIHFM